MSRKALPYRETSDCFILYKGQLVARAVRNANTGSSYLNLPGGGVDPGERPAAAARRECVEEVGAKLKSLTSVVVVTWDWFPAWADTPKRQERYAQFRGEKIHLFVGEVDKFVEPTSSEGDAWKGNKLMSLAAAIKIMAASMKTDHENMAPYRAAQMTLLNMMKIAAAAPKRPGAAPRRAGAGAPKRRAAPKK